MKHFGLIGYPLGHSFSVSFFEDKFSKEGIDATYQNFPLEDITDFEKLVKREPELTGLNVTVPYKQKIIPYLDALSKTARTVQAVNTICFCRQKDRLALIGHNTDVYGFDKSLKQHLDDHHKSALVLGTGGSSKAISLVLERLEIPYLLVSRTKGEDKIVYQDLDSEMLKQHTLIINSTPLGMHPKIDTYPDIPFKHLTDSHLLFDLVYNPEKSRFLSLGEEHGARIANGYNMLVYQAERSWEKWSSITK